MGAAAKWASKQLPDRKKRRCFFLFSALAVMVMLMAWGFSALPPDVSGAQSGWLRGLLLRLLGAELPELWIRKFAHFSEYLLIGLFSGLALSQLGWQHRRALIALALALAAAAIDETIQIFSGRGPSLIDVGIDLTGAAAGLLAAWLASRARRVT